MDFSGREFEGEKRAAVDGSAARVEGKVSCNLERILMKEKSVARPFENGLLLPSPDSQTAGITVSLVNLGHEGDQFPGRRHECESAA
jgi:hypothetical protein